MKHLILLILIICFASTTFGYGFVYSNLVACYTSGAQHVLIAVNLAANVPRIRTRLYSVTGELIPPAANLPPAVLDGTAVWHGIPRTFFVAADVYVQLFNFKIKLFFLNSLSTTAENEGRINCTVTTATALHTLPNSLLCTLRATATGASVTVSLFRTRIRNCRVTTGITTTLAAKRFAGFAVSV